MKPLLWAALIAVMPLAVFAADEVIISERQTPGIRNNGAVIPILGHRNTTQILDIGERSAPVGSKTTMVRITAKAGTSIWYKIGDAGVSAAANTQGNEYLEGGSSVDEPVVPGQSIDTAFD